MMVLLPGNTHTFQKAAREHPSRFGWLVTPRRVLASTAVSIPGVGWAADNECYALGDRFEPGVYLSMLWRYQKWANTCLFATAPDVLADAGATLTRSGPWLRVIRDLGLPAALVAQDDLEALPVPWDRFDCLFIGGSTDWKLGAEARGLVREAKRRRKWVHVGRVNSRTRLEYCIKLGVDSVDGTTWGINPDNALGWASNLMHQHRLQRSLPL